MGIINELRGLGSVVAAKRLIGSEIERQAGDVTMRGRIVETEAYDQTDTASHSYNGRTPRTDVMFGPAGYWYVYFTYGMHYCCNVVVGEEGYGAAVLIRAIEPISGVSDMEKRRAKQGSELTNGPAKLCQALAINKDFNGQSAEDSQLKLILKPVYKNIITTTRIGITKAVDKPWRFYDYSSSYVSRR